MAKKVDAEVLCKGARPDTFRASSSSFPSCRSISSSEMAKAKGQGQGFERYKGRETFLTAVCDLEGVRYLFGEAAGVPRHAHRLPDLDKFQGQRGGEAPMRLQLLVSIRYGCVVPSNQGFS